MSPSDRCAETYGSLPVAAGGAFAGAVIGYHTGGERWSEVPAKSVQVSLTPVRGRGVGARLAIRF